MTWPATSRFELAARPLWVERWMLMARPDADHAEFEMVCGKGGYVRAIARDLGEGLGCLGHVTALRRLWAGPFTLDAAVPLDEVEALAHEPGARRAAPAARGGAGRAAGAALHGRRRGAAAQRQSRRGGDAPPGATAPRPGPAASGRRWRSGYTAPARCIRTGSSTADRRARIIRVRPGRSVLCWRQWHGPPGRSQARETRRQSAKGG